MVSKTFKLLLILLSLSIVSCKDNSDENTVAHIIPLPQSMNVTKSFFVLDNSTGIQTNSDFETSIKYLKKFLKTGSNITLKSGNDIVFIKDDSLSQEAYGLKVSGEKIKITAATDQGAFYAIQSLRQLMPSELEKGSNQGNQIKIPTIEINDAPQFRYRGMHLDVGRHMCSVEFIKKYIDALALLKMNIFHWHLTEDQGWRIEIKKYPKLQEIAAYRNETLVGHYSDQPHQFDGKRYGGFYTQEEIKDIVAYASERFITIIPEIEMPGHSQAAIAAYPELGCTGAQVEVANKWGVFEEVYCPTETTFNFLEDVLDEVMELFPSKLIHIGGDEAPKTRWKNSSFAQNLMKEKGLKDENELQSYFIKRIENYLNSKGRQIIGWDEILEGGLAPNAAVMSWRGTTGAVEAAKEGHNVVMTPTSHCYFDYYQSENDNEPLAIGGYLPLEKVYDFNPIPEELSTEQSKYVLGAQGNIWTEYMPTEDQVEYMAFPRILAMSEVVWTTPKRKNYKDFVSRVEHFHKRLDALDINYANHLYEIEGASLSAATGTFYELKIPIEGKQIRYTLDNSEPGLNTLLYESKIPISGNAKIKAAVFNSEKQLGRTFAQTINYHKAVDAKITINKEPHQAYQGSGAEGLINGISGSDTRYGDKEWLGFWGDDITITIKFNQPQTIESINTRFHNGNGQWIYAPEEIGYSFKLEEDGRTIHDINLINNNGDLIINHSYKMEPTVVSQIEIVVKNFGKIPEGKQGAGNKAWTFIDEIIIN